MEDQYTAITLDGKKIFPSEVIVPILKEVGFKKLMVVGTGFYLTKYGYTVTAKHVVQEIINEGKKGQFDSKWMILHSVGDSKIHLRPVKGISWLEESDIAILEAENFDAKYPNDPLANYVPGVSVHVPPEKSILVTYGYPENKILDFNPGSPVEIFADYFPGEFIRLNSDGDNPHFNHPFYETSIHVKSGASGGPVFYNGKIVGINSRCLEYLDEGGALCGHSFIVPIYEIFKMPIPIRQIPTKGRNERNLPANVVKDGKITVYDLYLLGHIVVTNV